MSDQPEPDLQAIFLRTQRMRRQMAERGELVEKHQEYQSEMIENEVLVDLWKRLGDETESYWQAFAAVGIFFKTMEQFQENLSGMKAPVAAILAEALGNTGLSLSKAILHTAHEMLELEIRQQQEDPDNHPL